MKKNEDKIPGGAFYIARKIFSSELWCRKPATWKIIFIYILGKVNHLEHGGFERGEGLFNFSNEFKNIGIDITPDKVKKFLSFAREKSILTTTKSTRGLIVKVLNYNKYQAFENYRSTTGAPRKPGFSKKTSFSSTKGSTTENDNKTLTDNVLQGSEFSASTTGSTTKARQKHDRRTTINNNGNNGNNGGREEMITPPTLEEVKKYFKENGYRNEKAVKAWKYYEAANWHDSRGRKVRNWKQSVVTWFDEKDRILTLREMEEQSKNHTY